MPKRIPRKAASWARLFWRWLESPAGGAISSVVLAIACLALALVFYFYSANTREALCNFKQELIRTQKRGIHSYKETLAIARDNPDRPFGFDPAIVRAALHDQYESLKNRQQTIHALNQLTCKGDDTPIPPVPPEGTF